MSALDSNVKKKIFNKLLMKYLKGKTRILITHAVDFLKRVDRIIVMKEGKILMDGKYKQIKDDPYIISILDINKEH